MRMKSLFSLTGAAFAIALATASTASADVILPLGTSTCGTGPGTNCLVFDDFTVYSLALLNYQAGAGDVNGNDPYAVSTNGNALRDALVIGTSPGGATSNTDIGLPVGSVDNAYNTPTAGSGNMTNFATNGTVPNVLNSTEGTQGSAIPNNSHQTWDVSISALNTYLNGGSLVFFFNLNQTGSNQTTYLNNPEDALGWLSVTLRNDSGSLSQTLYLDGDACTGAPAPSADPRCPVGESYSQTNANNTILTDQPANHNEWAYIHGQICVGNSGPNLGAVLGFGSCADNGIPNSAGDTVNQNLGAGLAAFALFSQTLQTALSNPLYTVMSVDFRMAALDDGYEQLLIFSSNAIPQEVPEPLTITLFGAGIAGLGLLSRRKSKKA